MVPPRGPSSLETRQLLWKHLRHHYQDQDLGSQCTAVQLDNNSAKYDEQYDDEQQFTELIILSKFSQGIMYVFDDRVLVKLKALIQKKLLKGKRFSSFF